MKKIFSELIREKKIVLIRRCIGIALVLVGLIGTLVDAIFQLDTNFFAFTILTAIFVFCFAFMSCKCNVYYFDGEKIVVYVGYLNHYIKIDDEIYDERKTLSSLVPIFLACEKDDLYIETTISTWGFITTKVNGKMIQPESFFEQEN